MTHAEALAWLKRYARNCHIAGRNQAVLVQVVDLDADAYLALLGTEFEDDDARCFEVLEEKVYEVLRAAKPRGVRKC